MSFLGKHKTIFILAAVLLFLSLCVLSVFSFHVDLTPGKIYTISEYSKKVLSDLNDYLTVSFFYSEKLSKSYPYKDSMLRILTEFQKNSNGKMTIKIINPETVEGKRKAENYGLIPNQILSVKNTTEIYETAYSGIVLEYQGSVLTIPIILTPENLEYEFISKTLRLVHPVSHKVAFFNCTGWEDSLYNYAYEVLYNEGIDILFNPQTYKETSDCQVLVVFGDTNVSAVQMEIINEWIKSGKKTFFAVSPSQIDILGNWISRPKSESPFQIIFNLFGLNLKQKFVLDSSNVRLALLNDAGNGYEMLNYPLWPRIVKFCDFPLLKGLSSLDFYWPGCIEIESNYDLEVIPLIQSGSFSWLQDLNSATDPYSQFIPDKESMDEHIIAALSKNKDSELVLVADELFVSNLIESSNSVFNLYFFSQSIQHLLGLDDILKLKKNYLIYNPLFLGDGEISVQSKVVNIYITLFILIPVFIILIFVLLRIVIRKYVK